MMGDQPDSRVDQLAERLAAGEQAVIDSMEPTPRVFGPNNVLACEGDQLHGLFRILSGRATCRRTLPDGRTQLVDILFPGDYFGLRALLGAPALVGVEAQTPLSVQSVSHAKALLLLFNNANCALWFAYQFSVINVRYEKWQTVLSQGSALEKVAFMLLHLHQRLIETEQAGNGPHTIRLTQREISEYLGITLPHVCRTIATLRARGIVNIHYGALEIIDPSQLAACVENFADPPFDEAPPPIWRGLFRLGPKLPGTSPRLATASYAAAAEAAVGFAAGRSPEIGTSVTGR